MRSSGWNALDLVIGYGALGMGHWASTNDKGQMTNNYKDSGVEESF